MKATYLSLIAIGTFMLPSSGATILASYLDGTNERSNFAASVPGLETVSNISASSGSITTTAATSNPKPSMGGYWWTQSAYNTTSMHSALRFSMTLDEGYDLASLDHIQLELGAGSASGGTYSFDYRVLVYSGADTLVFTSATATYSASNAASNFVHETKTVDLSGFDASLLTDKTVTFDIQVKSNNGWQSRAMAIQGVTLQGTLLASIPEPSVGVSFCAGIGLLLLRRSRYIRKRQSVI